MWPDLDNFHELSHVTEIMLELENVASCSEQVKSSRPDLILIFKSMQQEFRCAQHLIINSAMEI